MNKESSVRPMFSEALGNSELSRQKMLQPLAFESEPIISAGEEATYLRNRKQPSPLPEVQPFRGKMDVGLEEQMDPCHPRRQRAQKIIQKEHPGFPRRKRTPDKKKYLIGSMLCVIFVEKTICMRNKNCIFFVCLHSVLLHFGSGISWCL